jgi:pimeloyl-ACP methyl ester carboxylesterase
VSWPEGIAARHVHTPDGVSIGVFTSGTGPPLVLVHGTAGDHTTFRVVGPILAARRTIHAIDRRGRGASGDAASYAIEREYDDLAAVARAIAGEAGERVDVAGHSYGGRCALGAALRTDAIARVVCYEGAPPPTDVSYQPAGLEGELRRLLEAGRTDELYATFLTRVVGLPPAELASYRADPVWPVRVATAATIVRELEAERSPAAGLAALAAVRQPVLQILGGESLPVFAMATAALDERLADGLVAVIPGARHAAHHTHPERFVAAVLGEPVDAPAPVRD